MLSAATGLTREPPIKTAADWLLSEICLCNAEECWH
jgi:hypothetical protein